MSVDVGAQLGIPNIAVLETLGRGGFGVVYKAFDSKMNRPVAVKVLTSVVDQSDLERFEQECRLHGPLSNHPSIVTVYDAGYTSNGSPYLVMELIEGGTLADHVARSGPVRWEQAVEWMSPICDAVQAAHDRGVLHRDIKPSNILLAPGGPRLADFGIACLSDATSPHFAVSWLHAAPESHENTRDARSDVYSLASTLYELVAGRAPFWAQDQQITKLMIRLIEEPPPHLPPPLGPRWLDDVLQRALSKNPAERPPTAAALAAALANRHAAGTAHAPFGFAAPILPLAGGPLSEQVTRLDLAPASVRLDSGSVSAQGWPVAGAGLAWSGEPSVIVVEQPAWLRSQPPWWPLGSPGSHSARPVPTSSTG
jgi:serine/threonine protein kinase